jgi:ketosteroid isomerase-like protein
MREKVMNHAMIAQALFEALAQTDDQRVRALCSPAMLLRQNGGKPMDLETLLRFNRRVHGVVSGFRYEEAICAETDNGFVEEHAVRGTLRDGSLIDFAACIVAEVREGQVISVREYVDTAAAAPMLAALAASK